MIELLYPAGFLAAIGILLPVLIHLWNVKSGKTLKIGSVALFGAPSDQRSRSLKITNWPLLLLRCLLLFSIAVLLAKPAYQKRISTSSQPGWILVEKANLHKVWKTSRRQLDSLIQKGYEIHDFDVDFVKLEPGDSTTKFSRSTSRPLSYYALLKQLNASFGKTKPLYLYTDNRLSRFQGKPPVLQTGLHWKILPNDSTTATWVTESFQDNESEHINQIIAHSTSIGTYFSTLKLQAKNTGDFKFDTTTVNVQIYEPRKTVDAAYVTAAILALRQYTGRKIKLHTINSSKQIARNTKLLFWLSEQEPSTADLAKLPMSAIIFQYAGNQVQLINSTLNDQTGIDINSAELYKRMFFSGQSAQSVWIDGTGNPILSLNYKSGIKQYEFYSRFRPDWNNLVWTNGLVMFLTPIILPQATAQNAFQEDSRSLIEMPGLNHILNQNKAGNQQTQMTVQQLSYWFWWLTLILLFLERWFSYKKDKLLS